MPSTRPLKNSPATSAKRLLLSRLLALGICGFFLCTSLWATPNSSPKAGSSRPPSPVFQTETNPPQLNAQQLAAQSHLLARQWDAAGAAYRQHLAAHPHDEVALLTLATIAELQGQLSEADYWRRRAQQASPLSPPVQASLLGSEANFLHAPTVTESRLKGQLEKHPDAAPLHFALGNLKLAQNEWREAEAAFLAALAVDRKNPDYLFNLAISLDHQRASRRAAESYQAALEAAASHRSDFDTIQALIRLRALGVAEQP